MIYLVSLIFCFLFSIIYLHPVTAFTQDLGRHLFLGKIILSTHHVPTVNLFSYTYPSFPFINHHWLSEVLFFLLYQASGINGLLLITTFIAVVSCMLLFYMAQKKYGILAASLTATLMLGVLKERPDLRPEIFSYFFLSLFVLLLYRFREKATKKIFFLIPIASLWVNMHVSFIVGIVVFGLFLLESLMLNRVVFFLWLKRKKPLPYSLKFLFLTLFGILFITLFNPNTLSGALYPFRIFQNYGYSIAENQTVFFLWNYSQNPTILSFFVTVGILFFSLLISGKKIKIIDWFLSIFFTILAMSAIRHFPLFVLGTFLALASSLQITGTQVNKLMEPLGKQQVILLKFMGIFSLTVFLFWQTQTFLQNKPVGLGLAKGAEHATDFFQKNNLKGPIFNNFDIGSFLIYKLYPNEKVFIDGRPEAYPASFIQKTYIPMQENLKIFAAQDKQYHFNAVFFSHTDMTPWGQSFLKSIVSDTKWQPVFLDDTIIILLKKTGANEPILKKYGFSLHNFVLRDTMDQQALSRLLLFFSKMQDKKQVVTLSEKLLQYNPNSCLALFMLATQLPEEDSAKTHATNTYTAICQ